MQPRPRRPSSVSSWPTLSLLAVYAADPLLSPSERSERLDDATLEGNKIVVLVTLQEEEEMTSERQGRVMGTVLGLQGFARTMSPASHSDDKTDTMTVHSSRRRMVWIEPEEGYFVHATIALPRSPSARPRHTRAASAATISSAASDPTSPSAPSAALNDEVLFAALRQAYGEYRLRRGSLAGAFEREGREGLRRRAEGFWRHWAAKWDVADGGGLEKVLDAVPRCALLTQHATSQLSPLLAQFAASHPFALPILLHSGTVVSLPVLHSSSPDQADEANRTPTKSRPSGGKASAPPPLTTADLLALTRLLAALSRKSRTLAVSPDPVTLPVTPFPPLHPLASPPASFASFSTSPSDVGSSNRWSTSLSTLTSNVSSLFTSPSLPSLPSLPSSTSLASLSLAGGPSPSPSSSTKPPAPPSAKPDFRAGLRALRKQEQAFSAAREAEERRKRESAAAAGSSAGGGSGSGGGWSLSSVSKGWGKLPFAGGAGKAEAAPAAESGADVEAEAPASATAPVAEPSAQDAPAPPAETAAPADAASGPPTPAVKLAPAVDTSELAEALGASPASVNVELPVLVEEAVAVQDEEGEELAVKKGEEEEGQTLELFCGGDEPFSVRRYERGPLLLALAHAPFADEGDDAAESRLNWVDTRAERLLEAVESVLEVVVPPEAPYPHRHLLKHHLMTASLPSSSLPSAEPDPATLDAETALLDSFTALHSSPPILESLTRLATSAWAVHRRAELPASDGSGFFGASASAGAGAEARETRTDVYAVLPAKTAKGKEASLLDAAEELRKVGRAYVA
ncbi:hypothetical protein JCM10207_003539 [Rhodosporidiobolus poonsookiae]